MCFSASLSVNSKDIFIALWSRYWDLYTLQENGISVFAITEPGQGACCGLWASRNRVKNEVWKPLRIRRISALYFLIKCVAAWLSRKSWPASELTLRNVCCYQNAEGLQEVNVPCKVQIFQSSGHIIHPWIAHQMQTPPECLYCGSCCSSSQARLEFVSPSLGWVDPGQQVNPPQSLAHSSAGGWGAAGRAKAGKLVRWDKDSLVSEGKERKKPNDAKAIICSLQTSASQSPNNSHFGRTTPQFSLPSTISLGRFGISLWPVQVSSPDSVPP